MSAQNGHEPRDPDEQVHDQEELQHASAMANAGVQAAAEEFDQNQDRLFDQLSEWDIPEPLLDELGPSTSKALAFGKLTSDDMRRIFWGLENEVERAIHEHNPGRLCDEMCYRLAVGINDRPDIPTKVMQTPGERRQERKASEAAYARASLGEDGFGIRKVADMHSTVESIRESRSEETDGRGSRIFGKVFG